MITIKEILNIGKYECELYGKEYFIYLFPEDNGYIGFYVQRKGCGIISHVIGVELKKLDCSIDEFINKNLKEWTIDYDYDISKIEDDSYIPNIEV